METALWEGERESGQTSWSDRQIWTRITALASRYDISEVQSCKTGLIGGWGTPRDLSWLFEGYKLPAPQMSSFPLKTVLSLQYIGNSSEKSARRDEVSAHTGTFLIIVSQNVSDCISPHTHLKKFPGKQVFPPTPRKLLAFGHSGLLPLGTSPPKR